VLYPQNGGRIVTIDCDVTSPYMYVYIISVKLARRVSLQIL